MTKAPMKVLITCVVALATGLLPSSVFAMSCPVNMTLNSAEAVKQWRSVNDGVMGGRSSGGPKFHDDHMVFDGIINTNGGGFSSIRRVVPPAALSNFSALKFRIKSDGRKYKLTMRTDARYGWRQVSFQAPLPQTTTGDWDDVIVAFENVKASVHGQAVVGVKFDVSKVQSLGIILADGRDGPFRLGVKEISACHD